VGLFVKFYELLLFLWMLSSGWLLLLLLQTLCETKNIGQRTRVSTRKQYGDAI
jgi:hypothetical protein